LLTSRLRAALTTGHTRETILLPGDDRLTDDDADAVDAAVLIAVTERSEPGVILTKRPETMRKHPGQIAFPGGRVDPGDSDSIAAALREAEEEIGLPAVLVNIIGETDRYRTLTGYSISPIIAVIPPDLPLHPNADEVAAIFEVPLAFLLNPANHEIKHLILNGTERRYHEINWEDRRIWGATAAMIVNLSRRLRW
jgi:8-oxo-dGTP pyrophosphatase MutT (NUDIX family)